MPRIDDRFYREEVSYADMAEAPRRYPESNAGNVVTAAALVLGLCVLAVLLIRGSLPAMTPQEIVQSSDYEGQQPPRHIFNLYSLKQQEQLAAANKKAVSTSKPETEVAAELNTPAEKPVAEPKTKTESRQTAENAELERIVKTEIAAKGKATDKALEKPTLTRDTKVPVVTTVTDSSVTNPGNEPELAETDQIDAESVSVLPVYLVKGERTNLRAEPSLNSKVIKTLSKGQAITVFDRVGVWVQVATNDGEANQGYVHSSLLEVADLAE